ncbi:CbtA family protein [Actinokineospora diospyrosa]|uniref:Membrane protein, predicted cobalt tansporter CbtA n=1 Tax=Actinokineospora diospyrosa TaxID=103728 RepID=A0ABT1I775_9PSEU|nr:CbtA family protein [Actinokineospora diospyrosa]MCP2268480.1 putative membrane protein, predicted cobalt tansporter CbtA [Actinokineospora diospyrosa]
MPLTETESTPAATAATLTVRSLLVWGLLAGLVGGLLAFGFAYAFGEPAVERAISIEETGTGHAHAGEQPAEHSHGEAEEEEVVSRAFQSTGGLGIGAVAYGLGLGELFSLAFAFAYGRVGSLSPRATALAVAGLGYLAVVLVPFLTYPANPPAVGNPDTIGQRTALFFGMIVISLALLVTAIAAARALAPKLGGWWSTVAAGLGYAVLVTVVAKLLPGFQEVPDGFPGDLIWQFRVASLGTSAVLWTGIGLTFAALLHRGLTKGRTV